MLKRFGVGAGQMRSFQTESQTSYVSSRPA